MIIHPKKGKLRVTLLKVTTNILVVNTPFSIKYACRRTTSPRLLDLCRTATAVHYP